MGELRQEKQPPSLSQEIKRRFPFALCSLQAVLIGVAAEKGIVLITARPHPAPQFMLR
jgi:hypothetical protein